MPNTREMELWRLVNKAFQNSMEKFGDIFAKDVTRDLLANGVTVQQWISVKDRLPDGMDWVLCACKDGDVRILAYDYIMDDWDIHGRPNSCYGKGFVTHWMPLPQPPEGE